MKLASIRLTATSSAASSTTSATTSSPRRQRWTTTADRADPQNRRRERTNDPVSIFSHECRCYPVMSFRRHAPGVTPAHWRNAWLNEPSDA